MKIFVTLLFVFMLISCGSTVDPFSGSGPFPVRSSGRESVAYYASSDGGNIMRIEGGFLIGGHISLSTKGNHTNAFQYVGVLGQERDGVYFITSPSTSAFMTPRISFHKQLSEASFSWMDKKGHQYHAKLTRL